MSDSLKQSLLTPGSNRYSSLALFRSCNPAAFHTRCCLAQNVLVQGKPLCPSLHPPRPVGLPASPHWSHAAALGLLLALKTNLWSNDSETVTCHYGHQMVNGGLSECTGASQLKSGFLLYFMTSLLVVFGPKYTHFHRTLWDSSDAYCLFITSNHSSSPLNLVTTQNLSLVIPRYHLAWHIPSSGQ